ncbi:ScyD/ScyE family protein [Dyadobacter sandarakinus]|uniref:ScyD/ScyE family protein n=1 Tax=Dyadobacter sandarakinus TaxID=2747268 RepID=A0ABX7I1A7_9BACT|nr:ScyD/ScyE family protein [Dyadobacter sandarakinus]QRQ99851.1 ScyD/ScyE family protein [Dyadobacter sandarakinus]
MKKSFLLSFAACLFFTAGFFACTDHEIPTTDPVQFAVTTQDTTLRAPIGLAADDRGNLWIAEIGTGNNDGAVVMITPSGQKKTVISGFNSTAGPESNEGLSHLLYDNGKLYIVHGIDGKIFVANVAGYQFSDPQIALSSLEVREYGQQIRDLNLTDPVNSNLFALTPGPDGHIYLTDAGANAIFRRDKTTGDLSLFAKLPKLGANVDAVPTGIVYDGNKFLVSTLSGAPFISGNAKIFAITSDGTVSVYKEGFTTLTHIALSPGGKPLVTKFADFAIPDGFKPFSGGVLDENGTVLAGGLMMPTDIKRTGDRQYHVISYALGHLYKLTY